MRAFGISLVAFLALPAASGCKSEATQHCHDLMTSAQATVKDVDSKDLASVEGSLAAVEGALTACEQAGRSGEVDELTRARNQLKGHADYMKKRAADKPGKKRSPAELAELAKTGDPDCPKGQAYRDATIGKEIKCTGPQPVDFPWSKVDSYYRGRGYKITTSDAPPTIKAEYGAELVVYTYAAPREEKPPRCLTLYPPPGMNWLEAAARATGTSPKKLENATSVKTDRGELPLAVTDSEQKTIIRIGDCG